MDKEKPFSCKDQKNINEYNKKLSKAITKEHLNNIEKLRENFKKEVITQYKENLINYLENEFMELLKDDISDVIKINISNWKLKLIMKLQEKIQNGDFE
ncbi:hypothetical protein [Spiroplasma endosymbiont of Melieria omissa]|uniref:hypothetical protein n=1 Tax=Spiroplasma endosymbiont of Melieria omissa TaxID=3139324 RepID=UPI003CCB1CC5